MAPILTNPYVAGRVLINLPCFLGREDILREVTTWLDKPLDNVLVISGQRRIGKTSVLYNLQSRLADSAFKVVMFDLMGHASRPMADVLYELACQIAGTLNLPNLPMPERPAFERDWRSFGKTFLPLVYAALGEGDRLVLMLDEFDTLENTLATPAPSKDNPGPRTNASYSLRHYLRELTVSEAQIKFIFVIGLKASQLSTEMMATFKSAQRCLLSLLAREDAESLIRLAERNGALHIPDEVVAHIIQLTACHPYFTQIICQYVFDKVRPANARPTETPVVSVADVDSVIRKALEAGEHVISWIWNALDDAQRKVVAAVASDATPEDGVNEEEMTSTLQEAKLSIRMGELNNSLKSLIEMEMLKESGGTTERRYQFVVELMRRWVASNKTLAKVKEELDQVDPLTKNLYNAAQQYFKQGAMAEAIAQLDRALSIQPKYLDAHRLMGDIYQTQGKLDAMVAAFKKAFELDPVGNRFSYEQALTTRAEWLEQNQLISAALQDYEEVLRASPNNRKAKERRAAILIANAERALTEGKRREARDLFMQAGATERAREVDILLHQREVEKLANEAREMERKGSWGEAVGIYRQLLPMDPDNGPKWQPLLQHAIAEYDMNRRYDDGRRAMSEHRWADALREFTDIQQQRPSYRHVTGMIYWTRYSQWADGAAQTINSQTNAAERRLQPVLRWLHTHVARPVRHIIEDHIFPVLVEIPFTERLLPYWRAIGLVLGGVMVVLCVALATLIRRPEVAQTAPPQTPVAVAPSTQTVALPTPIPPTPTPPFAASVQVVFTDTAPINDLALSPVSPKWAVISSGAGATLVNLDTGERQAIDRLSAAPSAVAFTPSGDAVLIGQGDDVWRAALDGDAGRIGAAARAWQPNRGEITALAYNPNSAASNFVAGNDKALVTLQGGGYSVKLGATGANVVDLAWNTDGTLLAATDGNRTLFVWKISKKSGTLAFQKITSASAVAFINSTTLLAGDSGLAVWDVNAQTPITSTGSLGAQIAEVAVSSDGKLIAAGDKAGTLYLFGWDGAHLTALMQAPAHQGIITAIGFDSTNKHVLTGGADALVKAWAIPTR